MGRKRIFKVGIGGEQLPDKKLEIGKYQVRKNFIVPREVGKLSDSEISQLLIAYLSLKGGVKRISDGISGGPPPRHYGNYTFGRIEVYQPWEHLNDYKVRVMLFSSDIIPPVKSLDGFVGYAVTELSKRIKRK